MNKKMFLLQSGIIPLSFLPTSGLFCKDGTQLMFLYILYLFVFSRVDDLFFSMYNLSRILISLFNSFVSHGFMFLYLLFSFLMGNLHGNIGE